MKNKSMYLLCAACLAMTACGKAADNSTTEEITTTVTEITETEKVSVTSETMADSIIETTAGSEANSDINEKQTQNSEETSATITLTVSEKSYEENVDDLNSSLYKEEITSEDIITVSAKELTIEILDPLIMKADDYMGNSEDFSLIDGEWEHYYNATQETISLSEYKNKWEKIYREVFSDRLVDDIPKPTEKDIECGIYVYSLGKLDEAKRGYRSDRGTDLCYEQSDWQIEVKSDTEVQLIHQAFYRAFPDLTDDEPVYFKDHKLLNQADDSVHQLRTVDNRSERLETYYYTLLWEDGHWKFDNFSLWI